MEYKDYFILLSQRRHASVKAFQITFHSMVCFNIMPRLTSKYHKIATFLTPCEENPLMSSSFTSQKISHTESNPCHDVLTHGYLGTKPGHQQQYRHPNVTRIPLSQITVPERITQQWSVWRSLSGDDLLYISEEIIIGHHCVRWRPGSQVAYCL